MFLLIFRDFIYNKYMRIHICEDDYLLNKSLSRNSIDRPFTGFFYRKRC